MSLAGGPKKRDEEEVGTDDLELEDLLDVPEDERGGLDDAVGLDDESALYELDIPPEDARRSGDDDFDAIPVEGLDGAAEYGWTADNESSVGDPMSPDDVDIAPLRPIGHDDGGEEGVEESFEIGALPFRAEERPDDEGVLADDLFPDLVEQTLRRLADEADRLPALSVPAAPAVVSVVVPPSCKLYCLDGSPATLAGGTGLYAVDGEQLRMLGADLLARATVTSVVRDGERIALGTDTTEVFFSVDSGASFQRASGLELVEPRDAAIYLVRERSVDRVWARTAAGALLCSEDFGASFRGPLLLTRVAAVVTTVGWVYALSLDTEGRSQLARSSDGGERWAASEGPRFTASTRAIHLAAHGGNLALSDPQDDRGPHVSRNGGRTWTRLPGLGSSGVLALIREDDGVSLYAAHRIASDGRVIVARHRPDGGESVAVLDLAAEETGDTVYAIEATGDEDETHLAVATSRGLHRVRIRISELA